MACCLFTCLYTSFNLFSVVQLSLAKHCSSLSYELQSRRRTPLPDSKSAWCLRRFSNIGRRNIDSVGPLGSKFGYVNIQFGVDKIASCRILMIGPTLVQKKLGARDKTHLAQLCGCLPRPVFSIFWLGQLLEYARRLDLTLFGVSIRRDQGSKETQNSPAQPLGPRARRRRRDSFWSRLGCRR